MGNKCSSGKGRKGKGNRRTQKGGATYAINQEAPIVTSGGVNVATVSQIDPHCGWNYRVAPQLGGRRTTKKQKGGGCGCGSSSSSSSRMVGGSRRKRMVGGGAGTGGYGFELTNDLGKVYTSLPVGACPIQAGGSSPAPIGSDAALREVVSYPSGYALGHPFSTRNESAHFLEPVRYDRSCMGGGRRSSRNRKNKRSVH